MLTKEQKKVFDRAYRLSPRSGREAMYAGVEAVLAMRPAEGEATANGPCSVCSDGGQEFCERHGTQEHPAPGGDMVQRMLDAYWGTRNGLSEHQDGRVEAMTAAAKALADTRDADFLRKINALETSIPSDDHSNTAEGYRVAIDDVRRLLFPAPAKAKTPEERVTIIHVNGWAEVWRDGKAVKQFKSGPHDTSASDDAEIYRLGLIAQLKADANGAKGDK